MTPALVALLLSAGPLTEAEAVQRALERSPALKALEARRDEVRAQGAAAVAVKNPQFRLQNVRSDRLFGGTTRPLGGAELALRWEPPNPLLSLARGEEAERHVEVAGAELERARRELTAKVRALHATALGLEEQRKLAEKALEVRRQLSELARRRIAAQLAKGLEQSLADLEELEARAQLADVERDRREALRGLAVEVGLGPGEMPEVVGPQLPCAKPAGALAELIARAAAGDPSLRERKARLGEVEAEKAKAARELVPWFDFVQAGAVLATLSTEAHAELSVALNFPLFDWNGPRFSQLAARRARLDYEHERRTQEVRRRVEETLADLTDAVDVVARYQEAGPKVLAQSQTLLEQGLAAGEASLLDLAQVQARTHSALRAGLKAELKCRLERIELDRLVGP